MVPEISPEMANYLTVRARHRDRQVDAALERQTPDELRLMREAAVMGYVQGTRAAQGEAIPKDLAILRMVVGACLDFPDLYPAISAHETTPDAPTEETDD